MPLARKAPPLGLSLGGMATDRRACAPRNNPRLAITHGELPCSIRPLRNDMMRPFQGASSEHNSLHPLGCLRWSLQACALKAHWPAHELHVERNHVRSRACVAATPRSSPIAKGLDADPAMALRGATPDDISNCVQCKVCASVVANLLRACQGLLSHNRIGTNTLRPDKFASPGPQTTIACRQTNWQWHLGSGDAIPKGKHQRQLAPSPKGMAIELV